MTGLFCIFLFHKLEMIYGPYLRDVSQLDCPEWRDQTLNLLKNT